MLIVVTGTALYNHMNWLVRAEVYQQLAAKFRINIYGISDTFDLHKPGVSVMHVRAVAGLEKTVVICVPCQQYQAQQASPMTYADAVRRDPLQPQPGPAPVPEGGAPPVVGVHDSQGHITDKLERCRHITAAQRQNLARLGALNLHWLWYAVSRSLSHVVIFHF